MKTTTKYEILGNRNGKVLTVFNSDSLSECESFVLDHPLLGCVLIQDDCPVVNGEPKRATISKEIAKKYEVFVIRNYEVLNVFSSDSLSECEQYIKEHQLFDSVIRDNYPKVGTTIEQIAKKPGVLLTHHKGVLTALKGVYVNDAYGCVNSA